MVRYEDVKRDPSGQLRAMLAFLDAPAPSPRRLTCAVRLSTHKNIKRTGGITAEQVFGHDKDFSCGLWDLLMSQGSSALLLDGLGYENLVSCHSKAPRKAPDTRFGAFERAMASIEDAASEGAIKRACERL